MRTSQFILPPSAFILAGALCAPASADVWTREGDQPGAMYAASIGGGGDINGDGFNDMVIGEPLYESTPGNQPGRVLVFPGSPNGFSAEPDIVLIGEESGSRFGSQAAILPDVDGDGLAELGVTAIWYGGPLIEQGKVYVWHGKPGGPGEHPDWVIHGGDSHRRLSFIHSAGDLNGDGFGDVVVGSHDVEGTPTLAGEIFVFHGSANGLGQHPNWRRRGNQKSEFYGQIARTVGDLNGDGYDELGVGAMMFDGKEENEGKVEVFFGSATGLGDEPDWTAYHVPRPSRTFLPRQNQLFGNAITGAGDVNNDGIADLVVGGYYIDHGDLNEGMVFVWHGAKAGLDTRPNWTAESNQEEACFGTDCTHLGDVNGDGISDLLVSAQYLDRGEVNEGLVAVYYGSNSGLLKWPSWTAEGNEPSALFGAVIAALGDVNGDGLGDFAVGSPTHQRDGEPVGKVWVYYGRHGGLTGSSGWSPRQSPFEIARRKLDWAVAETGWRMAAVAFALLVAGGTVGIWLNTSRRAARAQVQQIRSRLHDFVGSELCGVSQTNARMDRVVDELRATIWTLKQNQPTLTGLIGEVTDWAWDFAQNRGLPLQLKLPTEFVHERPVDPKVAELLHAAVRILVANVIEHARARSATLLLNVAENEIILGVSDDGAGFDSGLLEGDRLIKAGSSGLASLRDRVVELGGTCDIQTAPGAGTRTTVKLPIQTSTARSRWSPLNWPFASLRPPKNQART